MFLRENSILRLFQTWGTMYGRGYWDENECKKINGAVCCITGELLGGGLCDQWVCNGIFITYGTEKFSDRSRAGSWKYSRSYITAVCCSGGGPRKTGNFTTDDCRDGNCHNPAADSDAVYVQNDTGNRAVIFDC